MFRATLKSLLSRKLRLLLSGMAVVLGVMATSGALILSSTLTEGFDEIFNEAYAFVDVEVTGRTNVPGAEGDGVTEPIPVDVLDQVLAVDGVANAYGVIWADGARVVGADGKVVTNQGPPTAGVGWQPADPQYDLREGTEPRAADEVAMNVTLAERAGYSVGDKVEVLTLQPKRTFTLVGIFGYAGGKDNIGGVTEVAFIEPVAQELLLGETDVYTSVSVEAEEGVDAETLRDEVRAAVDDSLVVRTGEEAAEAVSEDVAEFVSILRYVLLGFAGVTLFVGIFLILNTFSILVAQRTGELALLRSLGAGRRQVINSVLLEAVVIGVLASTIGLAAGAGVAIGLKSLMESTSSTEIPGPLIVVPVSAVITAYVVGVLVTVFAALLPAMRAARIPPVAAMTVASTQDQPHTRLTVFGAVGTVAGAAMMGLALFTDVGSTLWLLLGGVLLAFVGVAMLTPALCRPVISVLGWLLSFTTAGKLGRLNSARNPRRTAITAGALMVGIALVTGVSVLTASLTKSFEAIVGTDLKAEFVVSGDFGGPSLPPAFDPAVADRAAEVPGVSEVVGARFDAGLVTAGESQSTTWLDSGDLPGFASAFSLTIVEGELRPLTAGEVAVSESFAKNRELGLGDTIGVQLQRGAERDITIAAIYEDSNLVSGITLNEADAIDGFRTGQLNQLYVTLADGADPAEVRTQLEALVVDDPEVIVQDQRDVLDAVQAQVDQLLIMLYVLLGLALIIAILGIVNTLALSVLERTRELGLVRAIGMGRAHVMQMITVESVVIAVFGALLGIAVGASLGVAIVAALSDNIPELALPFGSMGLYLVLAVIIGLFAAILPSIRAARTNVLHAISYE